ncbi:MAG: hypothetical protein HDR50_00680 [Desulfovibrio sp.]|uniref:hypothetical protein n=1 Tax=Desulfovibrio sp. TaxID=885 RepID=UPI001A64BDFD|nr:hypothetical protein [Desulfovibrio sp.]MBD5416207.1 hypothetical protein [Desulfovibrio sp.]
MQGRFSAAVHGVEYFIDALGFKRFAFALSFLVVLAAVIRASTTGLFYDEAFTYLHYARVGNFLGGGQVLNNHPLNTILIYILEVVSGDRYNDFIIRLPNLIFYGFYCYGAYLISFKLKFRYLIFSLFILNYSLFQFFYQARGYGIATSCIMLACYFFIEFINNEVRSKFDCFILFSSLAVLANGICIYITASLLIACYFGNRSFFYIKNYIYEIIIYCSVCIGMGCFMFYVTRAGYPIHSGGYEMFFLGIGNEIFFKVKFLSLIFSVSICAVLCYSLLFGQKPLFTYACVIYVMLAVAGHLATGRGFPIDRVLLPFYPLVICAVAYGIQSLKIHKYISFFCILILSITFLSQFFLIRETYMSGISKRDEVRAYLFSNALPLTDDMKKNISTIINGHPSGDYYFEKYKYLKNKYNKEN